MRVSVVIVEIALVDLRHWFAGDINRNQRRLVPNTAAAPRKLVYCGTLSG